MTTNDLLTCNISKKDAIKHIKSAKIASNYKCIKDMICHWAEVNYHSPKGVNGVLAQPIWYNTNIKIVNNTINADITTMNALKSVHDIYSINEERWKNFNEILHHVPNCKLTYLHLLSIQKGMPKDWLKFSSIR